ncbi:GNAT family N-acetyltransferase [Dyella sp.]|uniref:GNAT family N-acetyltransferase n=1 Tax=Dyella sp. TaxID=1869338 RepID=UPI002ED03000
MAVPPTWAARSLVLRHAIDEDMPFLRRLYGQTRAQELAAVPWPRDMLERFLDDQFALQHRHYVNQFGTAQFLIIEHQGRPIGRLYVEKLAAGYHIIDISIVDNQQGQGLGSALIKHLQVQAGGEGLGVSLHVNVYNPHARRLYERLGFRSIAEEGTYLAMRWQSIN